MQIACSMKKIYRLSEEQERVNIDHSGSIDYIEYVGEKRLYFCALLTKVTHEP